MLGSLIGLARPDRAAPAPRDPRPNGRGADRTGEDGQPDRARQPARLPGGDVRRDRRTNRERARRSSCSRSTWTGSSRSTTRSATSRATRASSRSPTASGGSSAPRRRASNRRRRVHGHPARPAEHPRAWRSRAGSTQETRTKIGCRAVSIGLTESIAAEGRLLIVGQADLALYEAKRTRLNAVVFNPAPRQAGRRRRPPPGTGPSQEQRALAAALARAVDAKDVGTQSHGETVAQLCVAIGERIGLAGHRLERLRLAGLLHDVGKIGIADAILQKPRPLDNDERAAMADHVTDRARDPARGRAPDRGRVGAAPPRALRRQRLPGRPARRRRSRSSPGSSPSPTRTRR